MLVVKREVVAATLETSHGTPVATVLFLETATTTGTDSAAEAHQSFGSSPWLEDCSLGSASAVGLSSWQTSVVETQSLPRHDLKSSLAVVLLRVEQGCQNRQEELCGEAHNTSLELWPGMADVGTGQGHCCMCCSAAEAGLRTVPAASLDVACMAPGTGNHLRSGNGAPATNVLAMYGCLWFANLSHMLQQLRAFNFAWRPLPETPSPGSAFLSPEQYVYIIKQGIQARQRVVEGCTVPLGHILPASIM